MKSFKIVFFILLLSLSSSQIYSQFHYNGGGGLFEGRFGITAGYTNYVLDTNVLFTKSQPGYLIGVVGTAEFTDYLELSIGINYMHHRMIFVGKSDLEAEPEDLDFRLENFDVPFILNYNFFDNDKWKFGVNAGFTVSLVQQYTYADESKENYILEPVNLDVKYLNFDQENEGISFNTYVPFGVSAEFNNIACNLRYNMGLSDPFRQAPFYNTAFETKAKQNFYSVSFTYFFDN
jgi:hypothetical protein